MQSGNIFWKLTQAPSGSRFSQERTDIYTFQAVGTDKAQAPEPDL